MNKKISMGVAVALMLIVATVTFTLTAVVSINIFNNRVYNLSEREIMYDKISEIDGIVRQNYAGAIDEVKLGDKMAAGYLMGIGDKYSSYISATDYSTAIEKLNGNMVGIGIEMTRDTSGYILVNNVYSTGPAFTAGLKPGDLIINIDDSDVATIGYSQGTHLLAGSEGTKANITYRRGSDESKIEITRKKFEIESVTGKMMGENGYVRISSFNGTTANQFNRVVDSLIGSGAKGLVFDLRDNGGGTLKSCAEMLDKLLPEGDLMSKTDASGKTTVMYKSGSGKVELPMVCIVNSNTASASELFSCALRDYGNCKLVGTNTYGKGVMQSVFTLNDGSAIEFTIAKLNPPKSDNYDGVGLKPDYEIILNSDKPFLTIDQKDDQQLQKALNVVNAMKKDILK